MFLNAWSLFNIITVAKRVYIASTFSYNLATIFTTSRSNTTPTTTTS